MSDAGFFRGTSSEQDNRFSDKEKKLLKQMRFSDSILKKVDMGKVKLEVLKPWISKRISELLGMEDDVLVEFVFNQLEAEPFPDARRIQINLTGFLNGKNARIFTGELWDMLLSAQETSSGIPGSILESKKEEIKKRNEEQEKINETLKKTVSRFNDRLKKDRDSPPSRRDRRSDSRDKSRSRSRSRSMEREKGGRPPAKTDSEADEPTSGNDLKKKEDSVQTKRHYRTRHSSSPSPDHTKRKSRSSSPRRDSRNKNQKDLMDEIKADRDREKDRHGHEPRHDRERGGNWRDREKDWGDRRSRSKRSRSRGSRSRSPQDRSRRRTAHYHQQNNTRGFQMSDRGRRDVGNDHPSHQRSFEYHDVRSKSPGFDRSLKNSRYSSSSAADRKFTQGRPTLHSVFNSGHSSDIHKGSRHSRSRSPELRKTMAIEQDGRSNSVSSSRSPSPERSRVKPKHNNEKENSTISVTRDNKTNDSPNKLDSKSFDNSLLKKNKEKDSLRSPKSSSPEDNGISRKKKKKEKKHKKHKKHKKQKKSKRSESEDDDEDKDVSGDEGVVGSGRSRIASSFLKLVEPAAVIRSEDLEKTLREKALESMKKAAAAGRD